MRRYILIVLLVGIALGGSAQEDRNWFQKVFGKKKDKKEQTEEAPSDSLNYLLEEFLSEDSLKTDATVDEDSIITASLPGKVIIHQNPKLEALDDSLRQNPIPVAGYRIQIFFGKIESARENRAAFIQQNPEEYCIIEHIPPNFSVQIGNFTNRLEAHKRMHALKAEYPDAILVPAEIDVKEIFGD